MCDYANCCVKVFDVNFNARESFSFPNPVWNVCVLNASDVVVTIPDGKLVQFLEVLPKLEKRRCLPLDAYCWGIAVHKGELYVICKSMPSYMYNETAEIRVLDTDGRLKRKICVQKNQSSIFADSYNINISKQGSLFTTNHDKSVIRCRNLKGTLQTEYQDRSMRSPLGIFVDDGDNIFVCGKESCNVQTVVNYKTKDKDFISSVDGISEPYSICFRAMDNTLIVTCKHNKLVFMFKLE